MSEQLATCGMAAGQTVLVHMAMSKLGWIVGGAQAVIDAFLRVLGPSGTLMMPAHSADNTDPAQWQYPPVPESWWPVIRDNMPAFDSQRTPTRQMGRVPELFRTWPGVLRSNHPVGSFAACGPNAALLTATHALENEFGPESPIGRLYELDGHILLLGVDHGNNTSLHMAEHRAQWPSKRYMQQGSAMMVDGQRQWVSYTALDLNDDDFPALGDAYEAEHRIPRGRVGQAEARFMQQRPLVDYAVTWMERHRT
jgi:aminoglycoside 3-N-acetyltransferase